MWGVGDLPHGQPHNIRPAVFGLYFELMKTTPSNAALTFGGLIENFYNAYGERNAKGFCDWRSEQTSSCFVDAIVAW